MNGLLEEKDILECLNHLSNTIKKLEKDEDIDKELEILIEKYDTIINTDTKLEIPTDIVRHIDEGFNPDEYGRLQVWHRISTIDQEKSRKMAFLKAKDVLRGLQLDDDTTL